jgi:CCR4-NOT transcription complex subunit 9
MQQHMFTHQQQYPGEWAQGHHQQAHQHVAQQGQLHAQAAQQVHAQAQAAAAAAAAAQQQHYNRTSMPGNNMIPRGPANDVQASADVGMTEENKRVLDWIAQLMKPNTRESALLELSKKREQVPELALILWHSFGTDTAYWRRTIAANNVQVSWRRSSRRSYPYTRCSTPPS